MISLKVVSPVKTGAQHFLKCLRLLDSGWSLSRWKSGPEWRSLGFFDFLRDHQIYKQTLIRVCL